MHKGSNSRAYDGHDVGAHHMFPGPVPGYPQRLISSHSTHTLTRRGVQRYPPFGGVAR